MQYLVKNLEKNAILLNLRRALLPPSAPPGKRQEGLLPPLPPLFRRPWGRR